MAESEHPKVMLELKPGDTIAVCRCWASAKFPYCDGSHKQVPGKGPAVIRVAQAAEKE